MPSGSSWFANGTIHMMEPALIARELRIDFSKAGNGVSTQCTSTMAEMLMPIWQRVLQRPSIGIDDDFFGLGGNLSSADLLFAEISRKCGRDIPTATIFHAPTIAALASALNQPSLPRFSPFVKLKKGIEKPPILVAHGLDGRADFCRLAEQIDTGHSIYGIQAKGLDGMEEPFDRIEDMAEFYLESIGEVQSHGPYILIGYSFGGLVVFEMAQRLSARGKEVALLVVIEAYPHPRYLPLVQRIRLSMQRTLRHTSEMKKKPISQAISYFIHGLERRLRRVGVRGSPDCLETSPLSLAHTTLRIKDKAYVALERYRPLFYKGKIKFVKSALDSFFPQDPASVWANLATAVEVETVPGTHLNIVTTNFEKLAEALTAYVREAQSQRK